MCSASDTHDHMKVNKTNNTYTIYDCRLRKKQKVTITECLTVHITYYPSECVVLNNMWMLYILVRHYMHV